MPQLLAIELLRKTFVTVLSEKFTLLVPILKPIVVFFRYLCFFSPRTRPNIEQFSEEQIGRFLLKQLFLKSRQNPLTNTCDAVFSNNFSVKLLFVGLQFY